MQKLSLLEALKAKFPESSSNTLREWIKQKRVLVNSLTALKASDQVLPTDHIALEKKTAHLQGGLKIVYQDSDIVVVDKPAFMLSVATEFSDDLSAHCILKRHYFKKRVYPVHRLDKNTSGLLVFALNATAKEGLKSQFKNRSLSRNYLAIVHRKLEEEKGTWKSFLSEGPDLKMRSSQVDSEGVLAITHYKVIHTTKNLSLLDIKLETGRKNQIRIQALDNLSPLLGDKKYKLMDDNFPRLALHAYRLQFTHPTQKKTLCFKSLFPRELQDIIDVRVIIGEEAISLQMG